MHPKANKRRLLEIALENFRAWEMPQKDPSVVTFCFDTEENELSEVDTSTFGDTWTGDE